MPSRKKRLLRQILASRVRSERLSREWSQEELAGQAGLSQVYISQLESAKRAVSIDCIEQLAGAFGIEAASLLRQA
jgi:transcriptional regulator with XRE-family HTH domain